MILCRLSRSGAEKVAWAFAPTYRPPRPRRQPDRGVSVRSGLGVVGAAPRVCVEGRPRRRRHRGRRGLLRKDGPHWPARLRHRFGRPEGLGSEPGPPLALRAFGGKTVHWTVFFPPSPPSAGCMSAPEPSPSDSPASGSNRSPASPGAPPVRG